MNDVWMLHTCRTCTANLIWGAPLARLFVTSPHLQELLLPPPPYVSQLLPAHPPLSRCATAPLFRGAGWGLCPPVRLPLREGGLRGMQRQGVVLNTAAAIADSVQSNRRRPDYCRKKDLPHAQPHGMQGSIRFPKDRAEMLPCVQHDMQERHAASCRVALPP